MPGSLLPVQAFEQEHRSIPWMDVEQMVHVSATVNRVPVTSEKVRKDLVKPVGGLNYSNPCICAAPPGSHHNGQNNWFLSICDGGERMVIEPSPKWCGAQWDTVGTLKSLKLLKLQCELINFASLWAWTAVCSCFVASHRPDKTEAHVLIIQIKLY